MKADPISGRADQFTMFQEGAVGAGLCKKGILLQSLVGEATAAGLFPGEFLVEEDDRPSACRKQGCRERAGGTASYNSNGTLRLHAR